MEKYYLIEFLPEYGEIGEMTESEFTNISDLKKYLTDKYSEDYEEFLTKIKSGHLLIYKGEKMTPQIEKIKIIERISFNA